LYLTAPCLVPNGEGDSAELRIVSDDFYPLEVKVDQSVFGRTLYVKRRTDSSVSIREIGHQRFFGGDVNLKECLQQGNPYVRALITYLFVFSSSKMARRDVSTEGFFRCILPECVSNRAEMTYPLYLRIWASTFLLETNTGLSNLIAWDLRLILSFYKGHHKRLGSASPPLLNPERLSYLGEIVERLTSKNRSGHRTS
jgi:Anaphase-promoting complex sub unit 1 C-terminal domain